MGYQAIYTVEYGYDEDKFRYVNADDHGLLVPELWDGSDVRRATADGIYLYKTLSQSGAVERILFYDHTPIEFALTDSRVLLRVENYLNCRHEDDTMASVESGRSRFIPAYRRGEKVLAGMIRYEWLSRIGYRPKSADSKEELLRLSYKDEERCRWYVDILFRDGTDTGAAADAILKRACAYRLAMTDEKEDRELYFINVFLRHRSMPEAMPGQQEMATVSFPTQYPAPLGWEFRPKL